MLKVLISKKLANSLTHIIKVAAVSWRDKYVFHTTPNGKRNYVKIRSLPLEEQLKYKPSADQSTFLPIPEILSHIKTFQESPENDRNKVIAFKQLYENFSPMIYKTVSRVIGDRAVSKDDTNDIKQMADLIFYRALENADFNNMGVVKYIQDTLQKQLEGKSREIFRSTVTIKPKDRKLLRAVRRHLHAYESKYGHAPTTPSDYDQIARDINNDPKSGVSHATPEKISDLLSATDVSLEGDVGGADSDDSRQVQEVIGPSDIHGEVSTEPSPEEHLITKEIRDIVEKSINTLTDDLERNAIRLRYGFGLEDGKHKGDAIESQTDIAKILGVKRREVGRAITRAEAKLRRMRDMFKLSSSIQKIIKAYSTNFKFVYVPKSIQKISKNTFIVDEFTVKKYGSQLVCSCGKNCFHKEAVLKISKD